MDFELTEDQLALQETMRSLVERDCPAGLVRAVVEGTGDSDAWWKTLVDGQWPGLAMPEALGGTGATEVELAIAVEVLGWAADPSPFLATTTHYMPLVLECVPADGRGALAAEVCNGGTGAAAFAETQVRVTRHDAGWALHGQAKHVVDGDRADHVAVVASGPDGLGVFVVTADQVRAERTPTIDASLHVADIEFDGVLVAADKSIYGPEVEAGVVRALHVATIGMAAATVGASQRIFDMVLEHIQHRQQFGVPIGSFQIVKHMAVDVYVAIERARALWQFVALTVAEHDPRRNVAASMAKAAAGDCQRIAVQHGIQLFGALGYTWENDLQMYVRRAKAGELLFGTSAFHRSVVARATVAAEVGR